MPYISQPNSTLRLWCVLLWFHLQMIFITEYAKVMANDNFLISGAACVNSTITFECTAVGPGATIWKGSAFDCRSSLNKIQLFHSQFKTAGARGTCNNGQIVGYGLNDSEDLNFRSRLIVQVTSVAINNTTVECVYDNGAVMHTLHRSVIVVITEPLPPPMNIHLSDVRKDQLEFSWDPVTVAMTYNAAGIYYNITSENCGRCPTTTSLTTVTCTDVKLTNDKLDTCIFKVSTCVCQTFIGAKNSIEVRLKALDISLSQINVIPTYENDTRHLVRLRTMFTKDSTIEPFLIGDISGAAMSYTINYTNADTGKSCGNAVISAESCVNICSHDFELTNSSCSKEVNYNVTIFGTNVFGNGKLSSPIKRDYINNFVEVSANPEENSIICSFILLTDEPDSVNTAKSCQITFFDNNNQQNMIETMMVTGLEAKLTLNNLHLSEGTYLFVSTANSSDTFSVNITGNYEVNQNDHSLSQTITVTVVIVVVVIIFFLPTAVLIIFGVLVLSAIKFDTKKKKYHVKNA